MFAAGVSKELKRLLMELKRFKNLIGLSLLCNALMAGFGIVMAEIIRHLIQAANLKDVSAIMHIGLLALAVLPLLVLISYGSELLPLIFSQKVLRNIKNQCVAHLTRLPPSYLDQNRSGEILSKLNNDTALIQGFLRRGVNFMLLVPFMILFYFIYLCWLSPQLTLVSFLSFPLLLTLGHRYATLFKTGSKKYMGFMARLNNSISDMIGGIALIKAFGLSDHHRTQYDAKLGDATRQAKANDSLMVLGGVFLTWAKNVAQMSCLIFGGWLTLQGKLDLASLVAFYSILVLSLQPIFELSYFIFEAKFSLAAAERVFTILDYPIEKTGTYQGQVKTESLMQTQTELTPVIEFDRVSFGYVETAPILNNISFKIYPDQTVALVGPSGGGKSSILQLICAFYRPQTGHIIGQGRPLDDWDLDCWRDQLGYVPQSSFLFPLSLRQNLALGREEASLVNIEDAAHKAHAAEFIEQSEFGYDTLVSERGNNYSGGQNQRLAIARAFLKDAPILLLDEATASLDRPSEILVQEALENLSQNRTVLVVAHRLSTVEHADQILFLDQGQIQETGTYQELIKRQGLFARLYTSALQNEEPLV